ncbi:hypothetical protein [Bacillus sp. 179-C3.3 HS]|uniref:hypothetical protein n=1 Tax=Bacillus sp. 179-C3.3 HS TaxID=3232162 RepID=UPI0039A308D7
MKKTITIILLSVAFLGAAGWIIWQQQTFAAAEEKHHEKAKIKDEQLVQLTTEKTDMKQEFEDQKKKLSAATKKLKKNKKAYDKEVKQRKALELKVQQLESELTTAKANAQANKQSPSQTTKTPKVKKDPNVTHNPPSQWVQDQYDWGIKQGYIKE